MNPASFLLTGGRLISLAPGRARSETADVLVTDGRIAAIGRGLGADPSVPRIDVAGQIVMPGFVDAHRHSWQTGIRGVAADWSLLEYARHIRMGYARAYRPEDVFISVLVGALEAIDAGITTMCDFCHIMNSPAHADAAFDAFNQSGMRAVLGYGFYDVPLDQPAFRSHAERLDDLRRWLRHFGAVDGARLLPGVALTEANLVTPEQTRAEIETARALGLRITAHMGTLSTPDAVARLHQAGLLGPDILHVHCNLSRDDELALIRDSGGHVCVTPETELQMGMGFPITGRLLREGLRPSIGIDIVSDYSGDMFSQMRFALQTERALRNDPVLRERKLPPTISPTVFDALMFATQDGANAMGLGATTGSIEVGKEADLVTLRTDGLHFMPPAEDVAAVVLQCRSADVHNVFVGGRALKRDGALVGWSLDKLRESIAETAGHLARSKLEQKGVETATSNAYDRAISAIAAR